LECCIAFREVSLMRKRFLLGIIVLPTVEGIQEAFRKNPKFTWRMDFVPMDSVGMDSCQKIAGARIGAIIAGHRKAIPFSKNQTALMSGRYSRLLHKRGPCKRAQARFAFLCPPCMEARPDKTILRQ
jgi:hypothetical protein